jgi:hypothetical protein
VGRGSADQIRGSITVPSASSPEPSHPTRLGPRNGLQPLSHPGTLPSPVDGDEGDCGLSCHGEVALAVTEDEARVKLKAQLLEEVNEGFGPGAVSTAADDVRKRLEGVSGEYLPQLGNRPLRSRPYAKESWTGGG